MRNRHVLAALVALAGSAALAFAAVSPISTPTVSLAKAVAVARDVVSPQATVENATLEVGAKGLVWAVAVTDGKVSKLVAINATVGGIASVTPSAAPPVPPDARLDFIPPTADNIDKVLDTARKVHKATDPILKLLLHKENARIVWQATFAHELVALDGINLKVVKRQSQ